MSIIIKRTLTDVGPLTVRAFMKSLGFALGVAFFVVVCVLPADANGKADTAEVSGDKKPDILMKNEIVARVNGIEITRTALEAKTSRMLASRQSETGTAETEPEALRREALNKLVIQELAYERAKAEGITISGEELDKALEEIKKTVGEKKYRETLQKRDLTEDGLRKELERNLLVKHIFEKDVASLIKISEDDLKKEYESTKNEFVEPEKVVVDDVVLFLDMDAKNSARKAADFLKRMVSNRDKDPRDMPSDGTFVVRQIELNKTKQPELYTEARKLREGQLSGVVRTPDSFHILKLLKYSSEVKADFAQIRGFLERRVRGRAQLKKMAEWETELKKDAKIEIMDELRDKDETKK